MSNTLLKLKGPADNGGAFPQYTFHFEEESASVALIEPTTGSTIQILRKTMSLYDTSSRVIGKHAPYDDMVAEIVAGHLFGVQKFILVRFTRNNWKSFYDYLTGDLEWNLRPTYSATVFPDEFVAPVGDEGLGITVTLTKGAYLVFGSLGQVLGQIPCILIDNMEV